MFDFFRKKKKSESKRGLYSGKFKAWVKFSVGEELFEGSKARKKIKELEPFIEMTNPMDDKDFHCCGEIIKGTYEFMAAPRAGRGYVWQKCTKCKKVKMHLRWMS